MDFTKDLHQQRKGKYQLSFILAKLFLYNTQIEMNFLVDLSFVSQNCMNKAD